MEKLMIALVQLAEAGIKYLEMKTEECRVYTEAERNYKPGAPSPKPVLALPVAPAAAAPLTPEPVPAAEEKPKRVRRTKEELEAANAAHEAAEKAKAVAPVAAVPPASNNPFSEAATATADNPLGGSATPAPAAPAPKVEVNKPAELTELESYDKMVKTMAALVQIAKNDTPNGLDQNRAYLLERFKAVKINDLTHAMRLIVIEEIGAKVAAYKKPVSAPAAPAAVI